MVIKEFKEEQKEEWNSFVSKNPFSNILQSWEWGEVKKGKNWEVIRVGVYYKRELVSVAQILTRHLPMHFKLYYSPYGPILDWEMPYAEDILKEIKKYLKKLSDNRYLLWQIEPTVSKEEAKEWKTTETLSKVGFKRYPHSIQPEHTIIVDLKRDEKDILASFEKDTRYSVRRSKKEGVEVKSFNNPLNNQPLKEFFNLYQQTAKRGQFPPRTWEQFERIWEVMAPHQVQCFQSWYKDELLSAALVFMFGKKAFLIYAGSTRKEEHKHKFANYLLQWEIIKTLKAAKYETYDMWGVVPEISKGHSWAGISLFKRGFKGEEKNYVGAYHLPLSPFYDLFSMLSNLRYKKYRH